MSITIGDAILYLSANPDALNQDLKRADGKIKTFGKGAAKFLGGIMKVGLLGMAAGLAAGIGILTKSVFEAADAAEAMAKFEATFGDASTGLIKTLDEVAAATGRSRYELRESAADFGAVAKAMGFTEEGAADMSAAALEMAVDLGAFHNLPTADVAERIRKALTGETESMKMLGIVINQNRIKQELLNMGIEESVNEVDEATKAQAIFNIIQRQSTDAVGIAAEESGSFTGQVVALKAAWKDFMVDVGTKLLPIITPMVVQFGELAREVLPLVVTWVSEKLVPALTTFGTFMQDNVIPAISTVAAWIQDTLVPALKEMATWFEEHILPVITAVAEVVSAVLVKAFEILSGLWENYIQPALEGLWKWFDKLIEPLGGVAGIIEKVVDWLKELADLIRNIELPDWLKSESPTPFEKGLRGIGDALEKAVMPQLGELAVQLQAAGGGAVGQDNRAYDYSHTTRVDQLTVNNGRDEQGIMQFLRNLGRV